MSRRLHDESGAALVTVLLAIILIGGLAVSLTGFAVSESRATGNSRDYEHALHAAESAVDDVVLDLFDDSNYVTGETYDPATPGDPDSERDWAIAAFEAVLADPAQAPRVVAAGDAEAVGFRPTDGGTPMDVIFAVGRIGDDPASAETRVLRVTFTTGTWTPPYALLTGESVTLHGANNARIAGSAGHVHANGDLGMSGNPTISGDAYATGDAEDSSRMDGEPHSEQPPATIPDVDARRSYELRHNYSQYDPGGEYTGTWFDLCDDGTVRPPADPGGAPCSHPDTVGNGSGLGFRGWTWNGNGSNRIWTLNTTATWSGAYYVYRAEARISKTGEGSAVTVYAEAPSGSSQNGSIQLTGSPTFNPHVQGVALLADRDVKINGTGSTGVDVSGLIAAGEQIDIGGNGTINGAVVAAGQGAESNLVTSNSFGGSAEITYDADTSATLPGIVRMTHWNEL